EIISTVPRMANRDQLFGTRSDGGYSTWDDEKQALDARSGVTGWKLHDVRRSVATKMAYIGIMPHVVEEILAHTSGHKRGVAGISTKSGYEREAGGALAWGEAPTPTRVEGAERKVMPYAPAEAG